MFRALTVTSEYGSGGSTIAHRVAETLKWRLMDRALIQTVASTAQVDSQIVKRYDERVDPWWHRFHRGGLQAAAVYAGATSGDAEPFDAETVAGLTRQAILKAADAGNCVFVGRGAQCILQDRVDVLHTFIYGPWGERIVRVRGRAQSSDAAEVIRSADSDRASYVRTHYGRDWKNPHLYHMMISSHMGLENTAWLIVDAVLRSAS